jgi:hypothetical protein
VPLLHSPTKRELTTNARLVEGLEIGIRVGVEDRVNETPQLLIHLLHAHICHILLCMEIPQRTLLLYQHVSFGLTTTREYDHQEAEHKQRDAPHAACLSEAAFPNCRSVVQMEMGTIIQFGLPGLTA